MIIYCCKEGAIMQQDTKCENCKFFKNYYVIRGAKLNTIGGYCDNDAVHPCISKIKYAPKLCDKRKPQQKRVEVRHKDINKVLKDIRKSLADIALILGDGKI